MKRQKVITDGARWVDSIIPELVTEVCTIGRFTGPSLLLVSLLIGRARACKLQRELLARVVTKMGQLIKPKHSRVE